MMEDFHSSRMHTLLNLYLPVTMHIYTPDAPMSCFQGAQETGDDLETWYAAFWDLTSSSASLWWHQSDRHFVCVGLRNIPDASSIILHRYGRRTCSSLSPLAFEAGPCWR